MPGRDARPKLKKGVAIAVEAICLEGKRLQRAGDLRGAWTKLCEALKLIPEPQTEYAETTRVVAAIGDVLFEKGDYERARDAFIDAVRCPGGLGDVFIHLRLGQCWFELKDEARAADDLTRAYMGGGREMFEKEDPKYFALLERVLRPPVGQERL